MNGYEAMRRFETKAAKMLPGQNLTGLQRILAFEFADAKASPQAMMENIEKFELMIEQHEAASSTLIDDEVKMAVMMHGISEELKAAVYSNPVAFDTYDKVRDTLVNLIIGRKLYTGSEQGNDALQTPMEVDALKGGKGKGKYKGKDDGKHSKGKDKNFSQRMYHTDAKPRFEGTCNHCGKIGHKKDDCWHNKKDDKGKDQKGKGKSKQDQKGKGTGSDVECWKCGKKRNMAQNCWSKPKQVAEVSEEQTPKKTEALEIEDDQWLMALDDETVDEVSAIWSTAYYTPKSGMQREILIDSGSEVTVCPSSFAQSVGTWPVDAKMNLKAIDGSSIAHLGVREVPLELQASDGLQKASMKFQVASVVRPVASVGELLNKGFEVHFVGSQGWMAKNGRTVEFTRRGNRFMLPVTLKEDLHFGPQAGGARFGPEAGSTKLCPWTRISRARWTWRRTWRSQSKPSPSKSSSA